MPAACAKVLLQFCVRLILSLTLIAALEDMPAACAKLFLTILSNLSELVLRQLTRNKKPCMRVFVVSALRNRDFPPALGIVRFVAMFPSLYYAVGMPFACVMACKFNQRKLKASYNLAKLTKL